MSLTEKLQSPKWQRARILRSLIAEEAVGREIFCKIDEIICEEADSYADHGYVNAQPSYIVPIRPSNPAYDFVLIPSAQVELLARNSEDFLFDDPPFQTWQEFLAQGERDAGK